MPLHEAVLEAEPHIALRAQGRHPGSLIPEVTHCTVYKDVMVSFRFLGCQCKVVSGDEGCLLKPVWPHRSATTSCQRGDMAMLFKELV